MNRTLSLLPLLFITAYPSSGGQINPPVADAIISGTLVDSHGSPVADATVDYFPFSGFAGVLPTARTSSDGSFVLKLKPLGKGVVSAYKTIAGFPNAEMALYGRWAYPSVAQIDLTPGANLHVDLKFSEPDALIEWTVMSAVTQRPVPHASYKIEWSDDPQFMQSATIPADGFFRFVLPKHPVVIHVEAPGFKDWTSTDATAFGQPVVLKPGTVDRRSIMLDPK